MINTSILAIDRAILNNLRKNGFYVSAVYKINDYIAVVVKDENVKKEEIEKFLGKKVIIIKEKSEKTKVVEEEIEKDIDKLIEELKENYKKISKTYKNKCLKCGRPTDKEYCSACMDWDYYKKYLMFLKKIKILWEEITINGNETKENINMVKELYEEIKKTGYRIPEDVMKKIKFLIGEE